MPDQTTKHYPDEAWLDFVRNLLSLEESGRMQAHIDNGCEKCTRMHRLWMAVTEVARRESDYMPDESIVRAAKSAFTAISSLIPAGGPSTFLAPVFDSFLQALPAGVRTASMTARQLLYQLGPLAIDLRVEAHGETMSIAGQILQSEGEAAEAGRWDVALMRGSEVAAHAATNEFGEFYLEAHNGPQSWIRAKREGHSAFTLTLPQ